MRHRLANARTIVDNRTKRSEVVLELVKLFNESELVAGHLHARGLGLVVLVILIVYVPSLILQALGHFAGR
jgi:hypothetical protein